MFGSKVNKILEAIIKVLTFIVSFGSKKNRTDKVEIIQDENTNTSVLAKVNEKIKERIIRE